MAEEVFIPKLGQTVEEVTLISWLVEDGDKVSQGQELIEVETDKAIFTVEANAKGTIHIGPCKEGDVVPVLTVVAIIGKETDTFSVEAPAPAVDSAAPTESPAHKAVPAPETSLEPSPTTAGNGERLFISPRARKLASERGVEPAQVTPTGYEGIRIVERDVIAYLSALPKATPVAQKMAAAAGVDLHSVTGSGPGGKIIKDDVARAAGSAEAQQLEIVERIPLKGVRGIIAERMGESVHTTARVTLLMEADATEFVAMRERLKATVSEEWDFAPGYNDLLAMIVAAALRRFQYMNARLAPDAIEILGYVNLGMAVDTERGLLVPVVRDADQKSLRQFGTELRALIERARNSRSMPEDLTGGTFTITNLGMHDVDAFTPVINLPEAAILGVGRIAPKVVPFKEEIAIRQMWTLSLVFDHRLVDGAPAARFLQYIKQLIEEPYLLIAQ
ncbi:MAG: 2-oxo acid dehydrogenase subunit E2 [Anaerolineae bacterium]|nr:2-oxo acid dehydrogenase subunit E2 [Anaerolineae bacterium]